MMTYWHIYALAYMCHSIRTRIAADTSSSEDVSPMTRGG